MNTLEFLQLVVPVQGQKAVVVPRIVGAATGKAVWNHIPQNDHAGMVRCIESIDEKHIYFALAGFKANSISGFKGRSQENVLYLRALWLDIDVKKDDPKAYPTKKVAGEALGAFIEVTGLPSPLVVVSGGGLHVYWPLEADVSREQWKRVANSLKRATASFGLLADHSRTTDEASILRPVGTFNRKIENKPREVVALDWEGTPTSIDLLAGLLGNNFDSSQSSKNAPIIDLSCSVPTPTVPVETLIAMGAFVNAKSAAKYFTSKGESVSGYQLWLKSTLLPLKHEAMQRPMESEKIEAIFHAVSGNFDSGSSTENNQTLWKSSNASTVTLATFIAIARVGGFVDRQAEAESVDALIAKFNTEYAFVDTGGRASITGRKNDVGFGHSRLTYSTVRQFRELHADPFYLVNQEGKRVKTSRAAVWLESERKRRYGNITFTPGSEAPDDCFNVWCGWGVEPKQGSCALYLKHLREVICSNDPIKYKTLIQFFAHAVQRPHEKPGFMPVLIGGEGVGKGIAIHAFGAIFGAHYRGQLDSKALTGNFNAELGDAIVCFADEVRLTGQSAETERFKRLVTEPIVRIERKGHDACEFRSYHRFVLATNDEHAVRAGVHARRFFVVRVAATVQQNREYFDALRHELIGSGIAALHYHLRNEVDLSDFDPHRAPQTDELIDQKRLSLSALDQWFCELLGTGELWSNPENACTLNARILAARATEETGSRASDVAITGCLKRLFGMSRSEPSGQGASRSRIWTLPNLTEARRRFEEATGVPVIEVAE